VDAFLAEKFQRLQLSRAPKLNDVLDVAESSLVDFHNTVYLWLIT
jgi:hypothetical protein